MMRDAIEFDANGRDANGFACCQHCGYPFSGAKCPNPGCRLNRSAAQNVADGAEAARRKAEEADRARLRAIRAQPTRPARVIILEAVEISGKKLVAYLDRETREVLAYVKVGRTHWAAYTGSDRLLRRGLTHDAALREAHAHARTRL